MTTISNRFHPTTLVRLTAALLVASTVFFALTITLERAKESRETTAAGEQLEAGEASATDETGEAQEGNAQTEGSHAEAAEAGEGGEQTEAILGVNLENPWLVWGFVGVSLLLAAAVLRFGRLALLLTVLLAGAAALLDAREVIFQFGRANALLASLAVVVALSHAAAAILALMAWRAVGAAGLVAPGEK